MSTIEIGAPDRKVAKSSIGAAELNEQAQARAAKRPAIAKQRAQGRAKGGGAEYEVDRGIGAADPAKGAHDVDTGGTRNWRRAYALPSFPDPPGYSYCWIARHRRRHGDDVNLLASLREGWVPVHPDELDEEDVPTETFTGRLAKHGEVVGDETTILMKMPNEMKAQRDAYWNRRRDAATREVRKSKPGIAEANPKMPLVEDRNEISDENVQMRARRAPRQDDT